MPSSWSSSLRFELQFTGENINLWGDKLNVVLSHADSAIAGWLTKALSGDVALTTANASDDEARAAMIKFTGAGPFTVTIPSVSKSYLVWNACTAAVTLTTGAGATAVVTIFGTITLDGESPSVGSCGITAADCRCFSGMLSSDMGALFCGDADDMAIAAGTSNGASERASSAPELASTSSSLT